MLSNVSQSVANISSNPRIPTKSRIFTPRSYYSTIMS
jgi:hypothetical protein